MEEEEERGQGRRWWRRESGGVRGGVFCSLGLEKEKGIFEEKKKGVCS